MSQKKKSSTNRIPWTGILLFLGTVLSAYIGYLSNRSQVEIPIKATQTAEARPTLATHPVVSPELSSVTTQIGPDISSTAVSPSPTVDETKLDIGHLPLDIVIVIDNSCSMFPQFTSGCLHAGQWDDDPDFLRIAGASLFITRLGFAESNETQYQAGVISFGETVTLISPLTPLSANRAALLQSINNPLPEMETRILPALESAYEQLHSPNHKQFNQTAIVLITDGVPAPSEGQNEADIEKLVSNNPNDLLFIMLLKNPSGVSDEFEKYMGFWDAVDRRYDNVFSYRVEDANQIEQAYNSIVGQLQNTISTPKSISLTEGTPQEIFVSRYVQKMVLTVIRNNKDLNTKTIVLDPTGSELQDTEVGVKRILQQSGNKQIEVITIAPPRLRDDLKDRKWIIVSDTAATVLFDREGAYRVNFLTPLVNLTPISNVFTVKKEYYASSNFSTRFNLINETGNIILENQPIQIQVVKPNGQIEQVQLPINFKPDNDGVYSIPFNFADQYPPSLGNDGHFTFIINAGSADDQSAELIPIARARLEIDVLATSRFLWILYLVLIIVAVIVVWWIAKKLKAKTQLTQSPSKA